MTARLPDSAIATALAGAACIASSAVLMKLAGSSAVADSLFRASFALPLLYPLARRERGRGIPALVGRAVWTARLAGVLLALDLVAWQRSIEAVGAGMATVLGNMQVVIVAGLSWALLGERPRRSLVTALPVMLVGVVLVAGLIGTRTTGHHPALGVFFGVVTSVLYSGYILVLRQVTTSPKTPSAIPGVPAHAAPPRPPVVQPLYHATVGAAAASLVMAVALPGFRIGPWWPALGWLALLAVTSQVVGWLLITVSMPRLPAGLLGRPSARAAGRFGRPGCGRPGGVPVGGSVGGRGPGPVGRAHRDRLTALAVAPSAGGPCPLHG
jgi:drug/metabolite transporter (DMT)-like permease